MQSINFEDAVPGKNTIVGAFKSRAALIDACEKMDPAHPDYLAWCKRHNVDPNSGSITTTAYNPVLSERREAAQESQLRVHAGDIPSSGLSYQIHPFVEYALEEAEKEGSSDPYKILMISTTRENMYFDLQKQHPNLNIHMVVAAPDQASAERSNDLIQTKAPDLADKVEYKSEWQGQGYDHAIVNAAAFYLDEQGLEDLVAQIAGTGARSVTFINQMRNDDADGDPQWKAQLNDGVIPLRVPARGELARLMQKAGYDVDSHAAAPATFDQHKASGFAAQNPALDHFSFTLRP